MEIQSQTIPEGNLVTVSGRLDAGTGVEFENAVGAVIKESAGPVILECGGLEYMSSGGIRSLLALLRQMQAASRPLLLAGLPPTVKEIVRIAGLERHLSLFDTVDSARASLSNS